MSSSKPSLENFNKQIEKIFQQSFDISLSTDDSSYMYHSTTTIQLTVTNNSEDPVYYICSGDIYLEEITDTVITNSWKVHGFYMCIDPITIEPSITDTFLFNLFTLSQNGYLDSDFLKDSVQYRFKMDLFKDDSFTELIQDSSRISNSFPVIDFNPCYLGPDLGNCYAYFVRYYFDQDEEKCKDFVWGGGEGVIPFETLEACQESCK